jgi:hypothetical protein
MGFNVLVVSLASKSSSSYTTPCLGDKDSTEFQIRVLSYDNHYFLWRPPWAGSLCDKVCIQEKEQLKVVEQARKKSPEEGQGGGDEEEEEGKNLLI